MINKRLFRDAFILLAVVGVLNMTATLLHLYWTSRWFDKPIHFLAGVTVAMTAILLWQYYRKTNYINFRTAIKIAIISTLFIGLLWEVYELYFEITFFSDKSNYFRDTFLDLIMDTSGGIFGSLYSHRILSKVIKNG